MKTAQPQTNATSAQTGTFTSSHPIALSLRENHLIQTLVQNGETSRHDLDRLVGAENTPDIILHLRHKQQMDIPMTKRKFIDRDGKATYPGFYSLSEKDIARLRGRYPDDSAKL